jgi:hypothetical protein
MKMNTWIQTYTGKAFDLLAPMPHMVCVEDIAHHLALINRFTGATAEPYSVAQHSVLCSYIVPPELALTALLHDASEAYVTDVSRPLKEAMRTLVAGKPTTYDMIADGVERAVGLRFGVDLVNLDPVVKAADMTMLATERVHLHHSAPKSWDVNVEPAVFAAPDIAPWSWRYAEGRFLTRFWTLMHERSTP